MQHLDEGKIHSWLDGALSAEEAARAERHVGECAQCAAAVAEARGFIAASSRILTALDNAPRGVIPVAAPRKRVNPLVWRVAATVLVVAAGTLVVVQNRGSNAMKAVSADQALTSPQAAPVSELGGAAQTGTVGGADGAPANARVSEVPTTRPTTRPTTVGSAAKAATSNPRRGTTTDDTKALSEGISAAAGQTTIASDYAAVPTRAAPTGAVSGVGAVGMRDAAAEPERLKVVSSPRQIGARVTLYEVAPGDTVTLTESMPTALNSIVLRGAVRTQMAPQTTGKSAAAPSTGRADAAATAVPESRRTGEVAAAAPAVSMPAPAALTGTVIPLHTITWTDSATGNRLTLSGRMPEARLQEIRISIERERAAAARKNP
jgi:putative zinc finger protein